MSTADTLREYLQKMGWTQSDLAAVIGRDVGLVNRIANDKRGISARTALDLAAAFNTTPEFWARIWSAERLAKSAAATKRLQQEITPPGDTS